MASYFKDKSRGGTWTCQYAIPGRDRPGVKRGFARRKDAEKWFSESRFSIDAGTIRQADKYTVASWMEHWLSTCCQGAQPNTLRIHRQAIDNHIIPILGGIRLSALTPAHVRDFLSKLSQTLSPSTARLMYSRLQSALRVAADDGMIPRSPCTKAVKLPPLPSKRPAFCTQEQARAVLSALDGGKYAIPVRFCAMLGLRRGEALGVKWADIDGDKIHIHAQVTLEDGRPVYKQTKTARSIRTLHLPPSLKAALSVHYKKQLQEKLQYGPLYQDEGFVCAGEGGGCLSPSSMTNTVKYHLRQCSLPDIKLHDLRHTYATLLYQAGYPIDVVADLLGDTINTAIKFYVGKNEKQQFEAAQKADEIFSK